MDTKTLSESERAFRASVQRIIYAHKLARLCITEAHAAGRPERFRTWIRRHARVSSYIYSHAQL